MVNKKRTLVTIIVVGLFATMILSGTTVVAQAQEFINRIILSDDENDILTSMNHATIIDDENEKFVGKEVQDNSQLESSKSSKGFFGNQGAGTAALEDVRENAVVDSFADGVLNPINITNFQTTDNMTPEVIIPNGSAATFGQTDSVGWVCNVGEELVYQFEKYPSESIDQQSLVVGYILDGVMYPGEKNAELNGEYRVKVEKKGEYFIYVINAASDPLSLKNGGIHIVESEENK